MKDLFVCLFFSLALKSVLKPPKLAPSAWQLYFTDWIQRQQASGTRKLNVAQAAKEAGQEYASLSTEDKEVSICDVRNLFIPSNVCFSCFLSPINVDHRPRRRQGNGSSTLICEPLPPRTSNVRTRSVLRSERLANRGRVISRTPTPRRSPSPPTSCSYSASARTPNWYWTYLGTRQKQPNKVFWQLRSGDP